MKLYGFTGSRSARISWMLEELNIDYDLIELDITAGDLFKEDFLKLNPAGKVPVLVDDDLVLTESAAIITYLGDKYPDKQLVPACGSTAVEREKRAVYNQWCFFALSELEQPLWTMAKHSFVFPEHLRLPGIQKSALWEFRNILKVLEQGLGNKQYILGDNFSAADILIGNTLAWAMNRKIKLKNEVVEHYCQRLFSRPAFKKVTATNDKVDELYKQS